jgi:predicted nuclease of predicted toxin-antitoxin system
MRVLLDECVPKRLLKHLSGFDFAHALNLGWDGKQNGELLSAMREEGFAVLVTVDKNLVYQQNILSSGIAVITLSSQGNRVVDLLPLIPDLLQTIPMITPGQVVELK